ncbi:MAG: YdbH domain-containing protein [Pseudomonadales bacterium]|nr:YdbH domain-containing protein [Pseudomonadales bacterium]
MSIGSLLFGLWWFTPLWLPWLVIYVGTEQQLQITEFEVNRPNGNGIEIPSLSLSSDTVAIQATNLNISGINLTQLSHLNTLGRAIEGEPRKQIESVTDHPITLSIDTLKVLASPAGDTYERSEPASPQIHLHPILDQIHSLPALQILITGFEFESDSSTQPLPTISGHLKFRHDPSETSLNIEGEALKSDYGVHVQLNKGNSITAQANFDNLALTLTGHPDVEQNTQTWLFNAQYTLSKPPKWIHLPLPVTNSEADIKLSINDFSTQGKATLTTHDTPLQNPWTLSLQPTINMLMQSSNGVKAALESTLQLTMSGENLLDMGQAVSGQLHDMQIKSSIQEAPASWAQFPDNWLLSTDREINCTLQDQRPQCTFPVNISIKGNTSDHRTPDPLISTIDAKLTAAIATGQPHPKMQTAFTVKGTSEAPNLPRNFTLAGKTGLAAIENSYILSTLAPISIKWRQWHTPDVRLPEGSIALPNLQLHITDNHGDLKLESTVHLDATLTHPKGKATPLPIAITGDMRLTPKDFFLQRGSINAASITSNLSAHAGIPVKALNVQFSVQGKPDLKKLDPWLSPYLSNGSIKLTEITAGQIESRGALEIQMSKDTATSPPISVTGDLRTRLSDWSWIKSDLALKNISSEIEMTLAEGSIIIENTGNLVVDEIISGFAFTDFRTQISGRIPLPFVKGFKAEQRCHANLERLSMNAFAGAIVLAKPEQVPCSADSLADLNATYWLELHNLELSQLVALENDKLTATGDIVGVIPVTYEHGKPSVTNGQVSAREGGLIKLKEVSHWRKIAGQNDQLLLAVDALENFHFTALTSSVNFSRDEQLKLGVAMQGSNPDFQNGRLVHYNVNLESNILSVLKSLEVPDRIIERLEKKYWDSGSVQQ